MSNNEKCVEFQPGDLVMLKSGSPNMVVVKVPADIKKPLTCEYWDAPRNQRVQILVPRAAVEKPEEHMRRVQDLEIFRAKLNTLVVAITDTMIVIDFDSVEDKQRFIDEKFDGQASALEEYKGKVN